MRRLLKWLLPEDDLRAFESEQIELHDARRVRDGDRPAARGRRADRRGLVMRLVADRFRGSGTAATPDHGRRARTTDRLGQIARDLRQSTRSLLRTPGLAITIVLTVGLGLGATTAMVSVIHAVVLSPLPYRDADRIVLVRTQDGDNLFNLSVADYQALDAQQTSFTAVAASQQVSVTVAVHGVVERQRARVVTPSYFSLLGLAPIAGRLLDRSDQHAGGRAVVLNAPYWRTRFGGDPGVVGSAVTIDGAPHDVVGVLSRTNGPLEQDIALFEVADWPTPPRKGPFFLTVLASVRPSVPRQAAAAELAAIDRRIFPIWQSSYQDDRATWVMVDLKSRIVGATGEPLWLVCAGVAGVLLIACVNAASLLLARALQRRRELAVRVALGASRGQIVRGLVAESTVLVGAAAAMATAVAVGAIRVVTAFGTGYIPRIDEVRLGGAALWWLAGLTIFGAIVIGVLPAWSGSRLGRDAGLDVGGRTMSEGPASKRTRRVLVAAEFAVATPLVIAAALIIGSLDRLVHVDIGMDRQHVITASISLPATQYSTAAAHAFWERTSASLLAQPGVADVAFADSRPPVDADDINNFDLEDRPTQPGDHQPVCPWIAVSEQFFKTTGLSLLHGRLLDPRDFASTAPPVILVDRAWARRFFGTDDVVGRRLHEGGCATCPWTTVIGEVATVKYLGLETPDEGTVYQPIDDSQRERFVLVSSVSPASSLGPTLSAAVHALDPNLAVSRVATIDDLASASIATPRYLSVLVGAFALTALLLSVVGIYGVMAHFVTRHARDIGIRLALGGAPDRIGRMVIANGLKVVVAGVALGLVAAALFTRLMASVLFGVAPTDLGTFVGVPAVMILVAVMACLLPARRAAKVEPAVILRDA
jgi:putative ABC transport system permease protein